MHWILGCSCEAKLCDIRIHPGFDGYGFTFVTEPKGWPFQSHRINKIEHGSPAEESGLQQGDRIIEVNGVSVMKKPQAEAVKVIKTFPLRITLLLVDEVCEKFLHENAVDWSIKSVSVAHSGTPDRPISGKSASLYDFHNLTLSSTLNTYCRFYQYALSVWI